MTTYPTHPDALPCPFCGQAPAFESHPTVAILSCKYKPCFVKPRAFAIARDPDVEAAVNTSNAIDNVLQQWNMRKA